jgi:hypothetical protein
MEVTAADPDCELPVLTRCLLLQPGGFEGFLAALEPFQAHRLGRNPDVERGGRSRPSERGLLPLGTTGSRPWSRTSSCRRQGSKGGRLPRPLGASRCFPGGVKAISPIWGMRLTPDRGCSPPSALLQSPASVLRFRFRRPGGFEGGRGVDRAAERTYARLLRRRWGRSMRLQMPSAGRVLRAVGALPDRRMAAQRSAAGPARAPGYAARQLAPSPSVASCRSSATRQSPPPSAPSSRSLR